MTDPGVDAPSRLAPAGVWSVDPDASAVGWSVKHLGFSTVHGRFARFTGELVIEGDEARASGTVEAASVDSGNADRDTYLVSEDFLDAGTFPEMRFRTTSIAASHRGSFEIAGELTLRDVTRPLVLFAAPAEAEDGRVRLRAAGEVHRRDYGLRFPQGMGSADRTVGQTVAIELDLVLAREAG